MHQYSHISYNTGSIPDQQICCCTCSSAEGQIHGQWIGGIFSSPSRTHTHKSAADIQTDLSISAPLKRCRLCTADSGPRQLRRLALCLGCTCWCCRCCDHTHADPEPCPWSDIKKKLVLTFAFSYYTIKTLQLQKVWELVQTRPFLSSHSDTHTNMNSLAAFQLHLDGLGGQWSWKAAKWSQIPSSDTVPVERAVSWEHTLIDHTDQAV